MGKYSGLQALIKADLGGRGMQAAKPVYLPFQAGIVFVADAVAGMNLVQILQHLAGELGIFPEFPVELTGERLNLYPALSQGFKYVLEISQNNRPVLNARLLFVYINNDRGHIVAGPAQQGELNEFPADAFG